mgnify:CR=1 FL=1
MVIGLILVVLGLVSLFVPIPHRVRHGVQAGPISLGVGDLLGLYADAFGCTEVQAADLLRDRPGLEAAVARPATYAHYKRADLPLQAAVLAHGIAEGQFFIDGNKRAALVAMRVFLLINGFNVGGSQADRATWILDLSERGTDAEEKIERLVETLRRAIRPAAN